MRLARSVVPAITALFVVSCGELLGASGDDLPDDVPDAAGPGVSDDAAADSASASSDGASPPLPACELTKPFVARKLAGDVNSEGDDLSATLTADETRLFFSSARGTGVFRLYEAKRNASGAYSGAIMIASLATTPSREPFVYVRGDGNRLVFTSDRDTDANSGFDLWSTTRADASDGWATPVRLLASSAVQDQAPFIDAAEKLWFSAGDGASEADIFRAEPTPDGYVQGDVLPTGINALGAEDSSPVVSSDLRTLYFATTRRRALGSRSFAIYVAKRASPSDPFDAPVPVAELEGDFDQVRPGSHRTAAASTSHAATWTPRTISGSPSARRNRCQKPASCIAPAFIFSA